MAEKSKQFREQNKDKIAEQRKQRYELNKPKIAEQMKQKVICEGVCVSTKCHLTRHKRSQRHQDLMHSIEKQD